MLIGTSDTLGRYLADHPILGALEISQILLASIVLLSWSYVQHIDEHIKVDILTSAYKPKIQILVNLLGKILVLGLFIVIAWSGIVIVIQDISSTKVFPNISIPVYLVKIILPFGALLIVVELIIQIFSLVSRILKIRKL